MGVEKKNYSVTCDEKMLPIVLSVATQMQRLFEANTEVNPSWARFKNTVAWAQIKRTIPVHTQIVFEAEWAKMYETLFKQELV